jgi:ABC-type glutathione transport system ATPase component
MATREGAKPALAPALVQVKGLSKRYGQRAPFSGKKFVVDALRGVDLEIRPHCLTAVVGKSGSGKSTLAACIALLEKPDQGQIWFAGSEVSSLDAREQAALRPAIQLVFQDSAGALNPRFTAAQIVAEPLQIEGKASGSELRRLACEGMEEVGLSADWADRSPLQLSGGQRQRLAIARALALRPQMLILDESLSGLDLVTQAQILNLLMELQNTYALTYLLISHDLGLVGQVADYVAVMHDGQVVEQGTRERVLASPSHEHTRGLVSSAEALQAGFHNLRRKGPA